MTTAYSPRPSTFTSIGTSAYSVTTRQRVIDVKESQEELTELVEVMEGDALILHPGEFVLGSTLERVALPDDLVGRLEGKSSLGRLGLLIHSTAGFVDPGFSGYLTLELSNVANLPITVYPEMKIGQISFLKMTTSADRPYGSAALGSKYQNQRARRRAGIREFLLMPPAGESRARTAPAENLAGAVTTGDVV